MKLNRLLRSLEKKYDYGLITDNQIVEITQIYFSKYQPDTIKRDIANINRLFEYELEYIDYENEQFNFIQTEDENELFNIVLKIITEKIETRNY